MRYKFNLVSIITFIARHKADISLSSPNLTTSSMSHRCNVDLYKYIEDMFGSETCIIETVKSAPVPVATLEPPGTWFWNCSQTVGRFSQRVQGPAVKTQHLLSHHVD